MSQLHLDVEEILKQTVKNEDVAKLITGMYKSPLQCFIEFSKFKYKLFHTFTINIKKNTMLDISDNYKNSIVEITNVIGNAGFGFGLDCHNFKKCEPGDFNIHMLNHYIYAIEDTTVSFSIYDYTYSPRHSFFDSIEFGKIFNFKNILILHNGTRIIDPNQKIDIDISVRNETYLNHRRGGVIKFTDYIRFRDETFLDPVGGGSDCFIVVSPLQDFKMHCKFPLWNLFDEHNLYYDPLRGIEQCN